MLKSVVSIALLFGAIQTAAADSVYLINLTFGGSGCAPADSSGSLLDINSDGLPEWFQIFFSNYVAQQGPGVLPAERRKNCNISVQMHLPQGWQFSLAQVEYIGFAQVPTGVQGVQKSSYTFPFVTGVVTLGTIISPVFSGNYSRIDTLGISSIVWSPCGINLPFNIRTDAYLQGAMAPAAFMTVDQTNGYIKQIYGFRWRRC